MGRRTTSSRAAALRLARDAKAKRDAARLLRERQIEAALADFYQATGRAGQIRAEGRERAAKIIADANAAAEEPDTAARRAVRTLRGLGQVNAEIAELCGISVAAVRSMASKPDGTAEPEGRQHADRPGPVAEHPGAGAGPGERGEVEPGPPETSGEAAEAAALSRPLE